MNKSTRSAVNAASIFVLITSGLAGWCQAPAAAQRSAGAVLWADPGNVASRNLLYGSGGEKDQPRPPFTFLEEDAKGSNPKFDLKDSDGEKWKAKLGVEARPEVAASRLLWAVGFFTEEDYFLPHVKVEKMPSLKRGSKLVKPDGTMETARLKRHPKHAEKKDEWQWRHNPFTGTRELNGLRVMMSLFNNWDVKDENNTIYEDKDNGQKMYLVADLGASFGTIGYRLGPGRGKGDMHAYEHSKFVSHVHKDKVDFASPAHSTILGVLGLFSIPNFVKRMKLRWIGRDIPVDDAKWVGGLLAQLSPEQIQDAFRAAGYNDKQIEKYSETVQKRIAELQKL